MRSNSLLKFAAISWTSSRRGWSKDRREEQRGVGDARCRCDPGWTFSYLTLEVCVPKEHPLRPIREIVNAALRAMDGTFAGMYADSGRDTIAPEQLLRGLILQSLYGLRSERLHCEQLGYNMLFRWFVGLSVDKAPWDHSTYTKNRDRLIEHEVVRELFARVLDQAKEGADPPCPPTWP